MIPAEAVEAAHRAWREQAGLDGSIFEYNLRAALEAAAPHMLSAKVTEARMNNDHIIPGGDGYSAGFHYALHCISDQSE